MFIARIKYSKNAIPDETEFATREDTEAHCKDKESSNPYVRWTEVDTKRKYPIEKVG
jgi:hypothetical protein